MLNSTLKVLSNYNLDEEKCIVCEDKGVVYITGPLISNVFMCPSCTSANFVKNGHTVKIIKDGTN